MKDAARLLAYFVAVVLLGALLAPPLFWLAQWAAARGMTDLTTFGFPSFFRRGVLLVALVLLWPLLRTLAIRSRTDLALEPNSRWLRDLGAGFALAAGLLLLCAVGLVAFGAYQIRANPRFGGVPPVLLSTAIVPIIEECFFRGFLLGILLRAMRPWPAVILSSAIYSIVHFIKGPEDFPPPVTWISGLQVATQAFDSFRDPLPVVSAFLTLFVLGLIMADARLRTRSLWLAVGLHAGWIFLNGLFGKVARPESAALPWIGRNLTVGVVPLAVAALTWLLVRRYTARKHHAG